MLLISRLRANFILMASSTTLLLNCLSTPECQWWLILNHNYCHTSLLQGMHSYFLHITLAGKLMGMFTSFVIVPLQESDSFKYLKG